MILIATLRQLKELEKRTKIKNSKVEDVKSYRHTDTSRLRVEASFFSEKELSTLGEIATEDLTTNKSDAYSKLLARKIDQFIKLASDDGGKAVIKKVDEIVVALKTFLKRASHRWVFGEDELGALLPYYVEKARYIKAQTRYGLTTPEHVEVNLRAFKSGEGVSKTLTYWKHDLPRRAGDLLNSKGFYVETPEAFKSFIQQYCKYEKLQGLIGVQMLANGFASMEESKGWGSEDKISMTREGMPTKVVLDDESEESKRNREGHETDKMDAPADFWGKELTQRTWMTKEQLGNLDTNVEPSDDDDDFIDDDDEHVGDTVKVPIHPYLMVFDLDKHVWVNINTDNLEEYDWNVSLMNKLILPPEQKELVNMLMTTTGERVDDIIAGKMNGVIVIATGPPGVGKTLTAEVFSEAIKRPLYSVQCSQLGLDINEIETKLTNILKRASRWGAILLMDEADVYIQARGRNIKQNAIVGVFLRLLEYYRGVLFMTSNRGDQIDDAILSRATAWVKYCLPDEKLLKDIWEVLAKQYGANFSRIDYNTLAKELPGISGRSVRNLLKLARMRADSNGGKLTSDAVLSVKNYQALETPVK